MGVPSYPVALCVRESTVWRTWLRKLPGTYVTPMDDPADILDINHKETPEHTILAVWAPRIPPRLMEAWTASEYSPTIADIRKVWDTLRGMYAEHKNSVKEAKKAFRKKKKKHARKVRNLLAKKRKMKGRKR